MTPVRRVLKVIQAKRVRKVILVRLEPLAHKALRVILALLLLMKILPLHSLKHCADRRVFKV